MAKRTVEEQVKKLDARATRPEQSVATSQAHQSLGQPAKQFLDTFSVIFENDPIDLEAMKLGAEWRASTRSKAKPFSATLVVAMASQ